RISQAIGLQNESSSIVLVVLNYRSRFCWALWRPTIADSIFAPRPPLTVQYPEAVQTGCFRRTPVCRSASAIQGRTRCPLNALALVRRLPRRTALFRVRGARVRQGSSRSLCEAITTRAFHLLRISGCACHTLQAVESVSAMDYGCLPGNCGIARFFQGSGL